jgi:hypothetical protein
VAIFGTRAVSRRWRYKAEISQYQEARYATVIPPRPAAVRSVKPTDPNSAQWRIATGTVVSLCRYIAAIERPGLAAS